MSGLTALCPAKTLLLGKEERMDSEGVDSGCHSNDVS